MIERPSRRPAMRPAFVSTLSCADRVLLVIPSVRAISPAATPSGPTFTSSRNTARRESWASAERRLTASFDSIFQRLWNYREPSSHIHLGRGHDGAVFALDGCGRRDRVHRPAAGDRTMSLVQWTPAPAFKAPSKTNPNFSFGNV